MDPELPAAAEFELPGLAGTDAGRADAAAGLPEATAPVEDAPLAERVRDGDAAPDAGADDPPQAPSKRLETTAKGINGAKPCFIRAAIIPPV